MLPAEVGMARLRGYQERVERVLQSVLPEAGTEPKRLHEAMRYSVLDGGKRLRPTLVYATGEALQAQAADLDAPACAVELAHVYSLVHDDLPAMDDDNLRRGRATCHRAYDEATAILVGDALQALAFQVLTDHQTSTPEQRLRMLNELANAIGSHGMVGGQAMDLAASGKAIEQQQLENIHLRKTGALIRAAVLLGALPALPPPPHHSQESRPKENHLANELEKALATYARCIGLAFQIKDDLLDVEGDTQTLGKASGSDHARGLTTYPKLLGTAGAKQTAARLLETAHEQLRPLGQNAAFLHWLADYIVHRDH